MQIGPRVITARNVNKALTEALWHLRVCGVKSDSRNGPVIVAPGPVITHYINPWERLVASPDRDANHVFHLMETIWMLAGENDVNWLLPFNSNFIQYAESDGRQWGAYGARWRAHFGFDQLAGLVKALQVPGNRRAVLGMWNPTADLNHPARDVPCNTHVYFQVQNELLDMTVCCRSNDVIWGAYGANAVHFSMLHELLASQLKVGIGSYYQFSNNFHLYTEMGPGAKLLDMPPDYDPYTTAPARVQCIPLVGPGESMWDFISDCEQFVQQGDPVLRTYFMREVAYPLKVAYLDRKAGGLQWKTILECVPTCDWKEMFTQWTARRAGRENVNG